MIGTALFAVLLAGAAADDARRVTVAPPVVAQHASVAAGTPHVMPPAPDPGTDPDHPSAAWLARMVRPCVRSGSRAVC